MTVLLIFYFVLFFYPITCPYPPNDDQVQAGSVLLPASRRGRYLANIIRRQAVDGTGIKFHKNADRINAEAKKRVDVLSDELLPYIIAEQERRTTLYKRVMTAIQNGEKGVTVAEIRNKPPLFIRKGLLYRCPANRIIKEPDGTGIIDCEDGIEPTQIMYDSCLSAEDKDLYVAENKYFFCNRHRLEGPDLPHNGSTIIGCAPMERTSLNYTTTKCALEDTDDVVVHYRYYPDRTYKYVVDLDPDHEVCDHWNPCQIGYIFSLPSPDQAIMANELWRDYVENWGDYQRDEIVPPIPEDSKEEFVHPLSINYTSSDRFIEIPEGYTFLKLWARRNVDNYGWSPQENRFRVRSKVYVSENYVEVQIYFPEQFSEFFYSSYYAVFSRGARRRNIKTVKFLTINPTSCYIGHKTLVRTPTMENATAVQYRCPGSRLQNMIIRTIDGFVMNVDPSKYRIRDVVDRATQKPGQVLIIDVAYLSPLQYGDFYAILLNSDGLEERIKVLELKTPERDRDKKITVERTLLDMKPGDKMEKSVLYACHECEVIDVVCNDVSALTRGTVAVIPVTKTIQFNFPKYDDSGAGVYYALFHVGGKIVKKVVLVVSTVEPDLKVPKPTWVPSPKIGEPFQHKVKFDCPGCELQKMTLNGVPLPPAVDAPKGSGRRFDIQISIGVNWEIEIPFGGETGPTLTFKIDLNLIVTLSPKFSVALEGEVSAEFKLPGGEKATKPLFQIGGNKEDCSICQDKKKEESTALAKT